MLLGIVGCMSGVYSPAEGDGVAAPFRQPANLCRFSSAIAVGFAAGRDLAKDFRVTQPDKAQPGDSPAGPARVTSSTEPGIPDDVENSRASNREPTPADDPDQTVGTGSAIALGCIAATLLLIVVGVIFLAVVALVN